MAHTFNQAALKRQRQEDLCEFQASLDYIASSRTAKVTQRKQKERKKEGRDKFRIVFE